MTPKDIPEKSAGKTAANKQFTMRLLIDDPAVGWRVFPLNRASAVYRSELPLPEYAGRTIRVASVHAATADNKIIGLRWVQISDLAFDSEGLADQDALMVEIIKGIDQGAEPHAENRKSMPDELTEADLKAIRLALGLAETPS